LLSIRQSIDLQIEDSKMPLKNKLKLIIKFVIESAISVADFGFKPWLNFKMATCLLSIGYGNNVETSDGEYKNAPSWYGFKNMGGIKRYGYLVCRM